jgi:conjugal transfer/entry exclusion protein
MDERREEGDNITVGDISGSQGVAIGRSARATVTGQNVSGDVKVDARQLRAALEELYDALDQAQLPRDQVRVTQTAAGNALEGVDEDKVNADTVVHNVQKIGETLKQANATVQEGTTLWQSVQKLAQLLGPLVGGARVVARWYGIAL